MRNYGILWDLWDFDVFFWVISLVILMVTKWDSMGLSWVNMMGFYRILMGF